jgi:hypothetical protein
MSGPTKIFYCGAAVLTDDPSADSLINLNGAVVRARFDEVVTGLKGAIDFLQRNMHVERLENLPYENILVPLTVFFSGPSTTQVRIADETRRPIVRWFWRTCFSRRYNSQPIKSLKEDVAEIGKLKSETPSKLDAIPYSVTPQFFISNAFRINSVLSKTFVLMLAQLHPRSFMSGGPVNLRSALKEYNRNEFHHVYPRNFLRVSSQVGIDDSCLANICFLSKVDNNTLGGAAPSVYRSKMPADIAQILATNVLPPNTFVDVYADFVKERSKLLEAEAARLLG